MFNMHADQLAARYTPTSPLSPRLRGMSRPLSPQPRNRVHHQRTASRGVQPSRPRYHPSNFAHADAHSPGTAFAEPSVMLRRTPSPNKQVETPRLMRERQREFIDRTKMSSKIAASSMGIKPDAPRLDPLGSPKDAVTPLTLEEATDYFAAAKHLSSSLASPSIQDGHDASPRDEKGMEKQPIRDNRAR